MQDAWGSAFLDVKHKPSSLHESTHLRLDCSKAHTVLGWHGYLDPKQTFSWTADWYRDYLANPNDAQKITLVQIRNFELNVEKQVTK